MTERRCDDCITKITAVAQKAENLEVRVGHLEHHQNTHDTDFKDHMKKEETAFADFYAALKEQGKEFRSELKTLTARVAEIVMDGMETHASLKEEIADKYVSKNTAILVGAVATAVGGAVLAGSLWFFTNVTTKAVTDNNTKQMTTLMRELTGEIRKLKANGNHQ